MDIHKDMKGEFSLAISTLGVSANIKNNFIKVGFKTAGTNDEAIVNDYGIGAKIITIDKSTITFEPKKFDFILIGTQKYSFAAVHPINLVDEVIGYKCLVKGR